MDAGLVGGLIGVGAMFCIVCTSVMYEKGGELIRKARTTFEKYKQQKQPLLVVTKENPVLLRTQSKQFQMKELLVRK
jgi:hypothetical protein